MTIDDTGDSADLVGTAPASHPNSELTLQQVRDTYYQATAKASDIARQLALAGIAFVWIFSGGNVVTDNNGHLHTTDTLLLVGLFLVIALAADLLQYLYRSAAFGVFQWRKEIDQQGGTAPGHFYLPRWINYPSIVLFWLKVGAVVVAYIFLGLELASKIS